MFGLDPVLFQHPHSLNHGVPCTCRHRTNKVCFTFLLIMTNLLTHLKNMWQVVTDSQDKLDNCIFPNSNISNSCIMSILKGKESDCVLIDVPMGLDNWQALISHPVSMHQWNHMFHHSDIIKYTLSLAWSLFFFKAENRKMLLCDTGKPGLLRYYFCWHSLCYSAAWWLSPRQCIISPMRTIIIRAVWMGRRDVEMQTWWWRSTQGRFSKMNKYKKLFYFLHLHRIEHLLTFTCYWRWQTGVTSKKKRAQPSCYLLRMGYMSSTFLLYTSGGNLA